MKNSQRTPILFSARRIAAALLFGTLSLAATSCANRNPEFAPLHDQGIIPVSRTNPYVGSNLYLAHEMEQSTYLYNFIKEKGVPQAIKIDGSSENSAELDLFYSSRAEVYQATPIRNDTPGGTEWVVRGPYTMDKNDYREVSQLPTTTAAEFEIWGRRETIGASEVIAEQRVILPAFVPTPKPRPRRRPTTSATAPKAPGENGPAISGVPSSPTGSMTLDQQALIEAKEYAERSPNGDVIHVVKSESETVTSISNWYTGSADNAKKVAQKNNIPLDAKLNPGTKIFVQGDIVVNPKTMK